MLFSDGMASEMCSVQFISAEAPMAEGLGMDFFIADLTLLIADLAVVVLCQRSLCPMFLELFSSWLT